MQLLPHWMMNDNKTAQVNLRMSPKAKALLRMAADGEHRSASNMVEHLIFTYCEQRGIDFEIAQNNELKQLKKGEKQ